ncbi:unnamed protein product [Adineta steineri]|uniref:ubiquitinyl hydrolase 1 n=1 Tax=Adineta steineri TaxID=433720 RepID=A0A818S1S0_9BILA|nr:unnamed protein product [Adineta steineri]CAF3657032.1 unnamed protein product [Adineta steineri]
MTILSTKKPVNNNKDATSNQQQQQQQQQQPPAPPITRARLSHDDEHSNVTNSPINLNQDRNEINIESAAASSSATTTTNSLHSMITTSSSLNFPNNSKRKSHNHNHNQHFHQTINKQARRRHTSSIDGTLSANSNNSSSNEDDLIENNASSSSSLITTVNNQNLNDVDQCNSEDEYDHSTLKYDPNNLNELEMHFIRALKEKKGFTIKRVQEDGACLFRAVSDQVFGDEEMHLTVRQNCMDYIVKNADFFREYITEDFDRYISRKRRQNCHGNHIEMIALSELYNRPIEVYEYSTEPINTVHGMYKTDNEPIRLSYHSSIHYNSIIDPWRPTAGHGLGLPDLEPGRAQESLIVTALRQSEESHIERAMLDDKLAATDWEATQDELIQQIARESYLEWLCDKNQQQHNDNKMTSSTTTSERINNTTEENSSKNFLPLKLDERKDCEFSLPFHYEDTTLSNHDLDNDDDDDSLMRQVLAMSQIEYVETLKKEREQQSSTSDDPNQPSSSDTHFV